MPAKTLSQLLSDTELDNAALTAKVQFYRKLVRQLEDILGHNGDKESILGAARRVVAERDLALKRTDLKPHIDS